MSHLAPRMTHLHADVMPDRSADELQEYLKESLDPKRGLNRRDLRKGAAARTFGASLLSGNSNVSKSNLEERNTDRRNVGVG